MAAVYFTVLTLMELWRVPEIPLDMAGAWRVEDFNFVSFGVGDLLVVQNSSSNLPMSIRNLRRYDIESVQEGRDIIDGLMA